MGLRTSPASQQRQEGYLLREPKASGCKTWLLLAALFTFLNISGAWAQTKSTLRVGHFPNITHAQALIGHQLDRQGRSWFESRLGQEVTVEWFVYNAGPSAMEALMAGSIDVAYVGPNPALNAFLRTKGREIRIVAGACSGGSALVVKENGPIRTDADFKHKRVGTPQLGNTQDVAARSWLRSKGFKVSLVGGEVLVIPTSNPDQLVLFKKNDLDAVWTVEPWVTRLVQEAGGRIYLDEAEEWKSTGGKYVTTHLVSSRKFLDENAALLKKFIAAHVELTQWIQENPAEAKQLLNAELKQITTRALPEDILDQAWKRIHPTHDPISASLVKSAEDARELGFLKGTVDLKGIYQLDLLNEVLKDKKLNPIR